MMYFNMYHIILHCIVLLQSNRSFYTDCTLVHYGADYMKLYHIILQHVLFNKVRDVEQINAIRRPGSASTVFFSYVASKILSQGAHPKSPVQNPKSKIPKIQNPQNPKSPNSKIQTLHIKICYIMFQKSKIQNPQNPENPKSKIQNPQNPKSPKSKIPKIPKIQNPKSPKSKILRQNPKFGALGASRKELLHNDPKSKIQNPQNPAKKVWILDFGDFGFWILGILDFGF